MLNLSQLTWIRFGVWMFLGLLMYFMYGIIESIGYLSDDEKANFTREEFLRKEEDNRKEESDVSSSYPSTTSSSLNASPAPSASSTSNQNHNEISSDHLYPQIDQETDINIARIEGNNTRIPSTDI